MDLRIKAIRQDMDYENGDITNVLVLKAPNGEEFIAIVGDDTVKRLIELRAAPDLPPAPPQPVSSYHETVPSPAPDMGFSNGMGEGFDDNDGSVVSFGGDLASASGEASLEAPLPEPTEPERGKSVSEQLAELKGKGARKNPQRFAMEGKTVPKDDHGYPIVAGLAKRPVSGEGDEDGIGQA